MGFDMKAFAAFIRQACCRCKKAGPAEMWRLLYQPNQGRSLTGYSRQPELVAFKLHFSEISVVRKKFGERFQNDYGRRRFLFATFKRWISGSRGAGALTRGANCAPPLSDLPGELFLLCVAVMSHDQVT